MTIHFEEGNLTFHSMKEVLKYKREHPEWRGADIYDQLDEPIQLNNVRIIVNFEPR